MSICLFAFIIAVIALSAQKDSLEDQLANCQNKLNPKPEEKPDTEGGGAGPEDKLVKADTAKVDPAKVDPAKVEAAKVDSAKVEAAKEDPAKVEAAQAPHATDQKPSGDGEAGPDPSS